MKFTLKRLLAFVALLCIFLAIASGSATMFLNRISVTNHSQKNIKTVDVMVWRQTVSITGLSPDETKSRHFRKRNSDSSYVANVIFADGTTLRESGGYVTGGSFSGEKCNIAVFDDRIDISQQSHYN